MTISPFGPAIKAGWDDVDPAKADYLMVPFTFKVQLPSLPWMKVYNAGDLMLPFIFKSGEQAGSKLRDDLRTRILRTFLHELDHFEAYAAKHIFIDNGDLDVPCALLCDSTLFKTSVNYRDGRVLSLPLPFPDPGPPGQAIWEAELDASFLGHISQHPIRERLHAWSRRQKDLLVEFRGTEISYHKADTGEREGMEREYWELMSRSKFILCPRGLGPASRRFYEALAAGRIPVVVGDSWKLPIESVLDYSRFSVRVPEGFCGLAGEYIKAFEMSHDLGEASELARNTYLEYFAPQSFRHFIEISLDARGRQEVGGQNAPAQANQGV